MLANMPITIRPAAVDESIPSRRPGRTVRRLCGTPLGFGFVAILNVLCAGIAGSGFTYGLTWLREREAYARRL
jgi:hypothetical protein